MTLTAVQRRDRLHRWSWALVDATIWLFAIYAATWMRHDFQLTGVFVAATLGLALAAGTLQVVLGEAIGPYSVGHQRASFEESIAVGRTVATVTATLFVWNLVNHPHVVPRSVPVFAGALALAGMFAARFLARGMSQHRAAACARERRVIVFGAGDSGGSLLRSMVHNAQSGYSPVALLDDDRAKRRLHVSGVRVRGNRDDIAAVARRFEASLLVIAIPQADAALIRELSDRATAAGLDVQVLPPLRHIIGRHPTLRDLRDVNLEDLLGRRPITLDTDAIAQQIAGQTVLVTGAGGSIGSELCRQIARFGPAKLYLLDRDESGLLNTELSLTGCGLLDTDAVILADIRDFDTMRAVFATAKPDLVFHAAALKHLPLLESFPLEAWKSNVLGTCNVLMAAAEVGVGTFVNISTDKAAHPTCVLGYSKRVTERLTADFARTCAGRYVSVRFGNVLGSRGSVVDTFRAQIERGGPITVTHPDVERFFMLIPEACQLVLEAGSIGEDGEVMILEMGAQVKIVELAKTLIRLSGRTGIDIVYTHLRPGEKLAEELVDLGEDRRTTSNPLVSRVEVPPLDEARVAEVSPLTTSAAVSWMQCEAKVPATAPSL